MDLTSVMRRVLMGSGLEFHYIPPRQLIILKGKKVITDLPHLEDPSGEGLDILRKNPEDGKNGQYLEGSRPEQIVQTIVVGSGSSGSSRSLARIRGRLRDIDSGQPVIGATMVVLEQGKGVFQISTEW